MFLFSVQFCETVEIAFARILDDPKLIELREGECNTSNSSPYPGVAEPGDRMNHGEFMRRTVEKFWWGRRCRNSWHPPKPRSAPA